MAGDGRRKETVGNPPRDAKARGVRKLPALHANVALEMEWAHAGQRRACATASLSVLSTVSGY